MRPRGNLRRSASDPKRTWLGRPWIGLLLNAGTFMYRRVCLSLALIVASSSVLATDTRPISSIYGICLAGFSDLDLNVSGPVDVEFASLSYRGRVVAQFRTSILAPGTTVPVGEIDRWRTGALVLVQSQTGYVGVKKISDGAYPSAYVSLSTAPHLPGTLSSESLMHGLVSCSSRAPLDVSSPPRVDAGSAGASKP